MTPAEQLALQELLARLREGQITSEQSAQLNALLREHASARERYLEHHYLCAALHWLHGDDSEVIENGASPAPPATPFDALSAKPALSPVLGFLGRTTAVLSRPVFWSILLVGVLFTGYVVAVSWNMFGNRVPGNGHSPSAVAVATITATSEVQWMENSENRNPQSKIALGEPLQLESGLVELQLKQGTTLVIEGPADWKINGENSATLTHGKLVAKVPQQAIGFTLETPNARIIDLGTEFGVEVGKDGAANVHVSKGIIDVQSAGGSSKPGPGQLKAGQSARITGAGATVETNASLPDKFKRLVEAGNKEPAALATNPTTGLVAYYPFDGDTRDHAAEYAANSSSVADDLKIEGASEYLAGQVGRGLRLTGGYGTIPFSTDLQLPPTFTIEAWIVAERLTGSHQRLVLNWRDLPTPLYVWQLSILGKGLEFGIGQADGRLVRFQGGELKSERWQHVAAVADGAKLRIYASGDEVAVKDFDGTLRANAEEGLGIGDSAGGQSPEHRFRGAIDELAIWNVALTPEQIAAHLRGGTRGYRLAPATSAKTISTEKKTKPNN